MDITLIGFDLDIIDLIESSPTYNLYGFIDRYDISKQFGFKNIRYLGKDEEQNTICNQNASLNLALGMDSPKTRDKIFNQYEPNNFVTLTSHLSYISNRAVIGRGSVIQHRTTIMPCAKIGHGCFLNIHATIHHESTIGNFSTMAPGSMVLGRVTIEDHVYIGAGAIVKENCTIGSGSVIGAGSVVINDIPKNSIVVGVPAKKYINKR